MVALDVLRMTFAWVVLVGVEVTRIRAPMIGVVAGQSKGLEQRFEPEKDLIFSAAKDIGQDGSRVMIDCMSQLALVALLADNTPHFIHLGFASALNVHSDLVGMQRA